MVGYITINKKNVIKQYNNLDEIKDDTVDVYVVNFDDRIINRLIRKFNV